MASVGGVTCTYVHGEAAELRERVDVWQVPGIDGYAGQKLGQGEAEVSFVAVKIDTHANVLAWIRSLNAVQGTVGTIVDDRGTSWTSCLIAKIGPPVKRPWTGCGGSIDTRGEVSVQGVLTAAQS